MGFFSNAFGAIFGQNRGGLENQIRKDGVDHAGKRIAHVLTERMGTKTLAEQFVLEELDGARQSEYEFVQAFVNESGYKLQEYFGAIMRTEWGEDRSELENLQLLFMAFKIKINDPNLRAKLSITVVDEVMRTWKIGKYKQIRRIKKTADKTSSIDYQVLTQVLAELEDLKHDKKTVEALHFSAVGLPISALDFPRVQKANKLMHKLSEITGQTLEDLFDKGGLQRIMKNYLDDNNEDIPF